MYLCFLELSYNMNILIVDNYDSFTYNLLHIIKELCNGNASIDIAKNDGIDFGRVDEYNKIILSPGPGIPSGSGDLLKLIKGFSQTKSILGVCLGHQAIGEAFGAKMDNSGNIYHGVQSEIKIIGQCYLFKGLPRSIQVGRYHSWLLSNNDFPECLEVTSVDAEGRIMSLSHKRFDVHGVQFHPESIMTPFGRDILKNFIFNKS